MLKWLEGCLSANLDRAGVWHITGDGSTDRFVSDGFMLNLASILAALSHYFTKDIVLKTTLEGGDFLQHKIMEVGGGFSGGKWLMLYIYLI